jgi:uncharacterized protein YqgV (UPF0045/DUF77 family)
MRAIALGNALPASWRVRLDNWAGFPPNATSSGLSISLSTKCANYLDVEPGSGYLTTRAIVVTIISNRSSINNVIGMAKATIKSKTGALITVEGSDNEVSKILSAFEQAEQMGQTKRHVTKVKVEKREQKKRQSAFDLLIGLREEGFFEKPKMLGDIARALEEKGYLYPVTTLSGVVLALVQKKHLRRKKVEGRWVYGK